MTKTYTIKTNTRRAARQQGLDPDTAVRAVAGGFEVVAPTPTGWDKVETSTEELTHAGPEPTKQEVEDEAAKAICAEADKLDIPANLRRTMSEGDESRIARASARSRSSADPSERSSSARPT